MPRIEIVPKDWDSSPEKARGDGTPTIDVCRRCKGAFIPGQPTITYSGTIGEIDCEHPPYSDCDYDCEVCGRSLTDKDN